MEERATTNMRIAWLIAGDEDGGVAQAVRGLASAVRRLEISPLIISLRSGEFSESLKLAGFEINILNVLPPPPLHGGITAKIFLQMQVRNATNSARPELAAALRLARAQAMHVLWPNLMPLAAMAASDVGIPTFWELPVILGRYPLAINRWMTQWQLQKWSVVALANSQSTAAALGNYPKKPSIMYLGADELRFDPSRTDSLQRIELGIQREAIVLGVFARLSHEKGQSLILEAMARLPAPHSNVHLLLLGGPVDGEYGNKLRHLARRLDITGRLHILGNVPDPERYYGAIDVAINARVDAEPFGLSVVEAMMMAKPVLVHALGGPAETVVDGVTGWHVHSPTAEGFTTGLLRALADRQKWREMGVAGRKVALNKFSLSRQAREYLAIVRQRLQEGAGKAGD